jgi:hypothetical protein
MSDIPPPPPATPPPGTASFQGSVKAADRTDLALIGVGLLLFIFSFFSYYSYSISVNVGPLGGNASGSVSAWHGFFGWFAVVLALIGAVLIALPMLGVALPAQLVPVTYGLFVAAFVCVLLALFVIPGDTGGADLFGMKIDKGHGFGYWISLVVALIGGVLGGARLAGRKLI